MFKFPIKTVGAISLFGSGWAYNWYTTASEEEKRENMMKMKAMDFVFSSMAGSFKGLGEMSNKLVLDKIQSGAKEELEKAKVQISVMEDAQKKTDIQLSQLHNKIERADIESMKRDLTLASKGDETPYGGGKVCLITDAAGAEAAGGDVWRTIILPAVDPVLSPLLYALPAQLIAYHAAIAKGTDVDQPRNLAKSVTVE
jgi:cell division protein FtsB